MILTINLKKRNIKEVYTRNDHEVCRRPKKIIRLIATLTKRRLCSYNKLVGRLMITGSKERACHMEISVRLESLPLGSDTVAPHPRLVAWIGHFKLLIPSSTSLGSDWLVEKNARCSYHFFFLPIYYSLNLIYFWVHVLVTHPLRKENFHHACKTNRTCRGIVTTKSSCN